MDGDQRMLLSANLRKVILKVPFSRQVTNWIVNTNNYRFYTKLNKSKKFDDRIKELYSKSDGKRCFIVGNGPSLSLDQLDAIKNEDSFGANRIYKIFNKTLWRPKYYVIQDKYDTTKNIYENLDVDYLFVSDFYWQEHGMRNENAICYHIKRNLSQSEYIPFSNDVSKFVQAASTVTYTMIQMAVYLGYKEIYLIGMDHNYANITNDKGVIVQKNKVRDHVFEDEKPNEVVANIDYMENAYKNAKKYCDHHKIIIKNATLGGKLETFERINFWKLFN